MSASTVPLHDAAAPFLHEPVACPAASMTPMLCLRPSPLLLRADSFILARWVILPGPLVVEGQPTRSPHCRPAPAPASTSRSAQVRAWRSVQAARIAHWHGVVQHTGV